MNDLLDPDSNFFSSHGFTNTTYFTSETLKTMIKENSDISFSVLHLNIISLNKNFESLKKLLFEINFSFKMILVTQSWCPDDLHTNNSYQLHQVRKNGKTGGCITIFIHKELIYSQRIGL